MLKKIYYLVSPLPLIFFLSFWVYLQSLEEWGAYGAAPFMVYIIVSSAGIALVGVVWIITANIRHGEIAHLVPATVLASIPFLWLLVLWLIN